MYLEVSQMYLEVFGLDISKYIYRYLNTTLHQIRDIGNLI